MGLKGQRLIPYVTSLPASPSDGQEVFYAADATNNVIWNLRYRSGSASTYKWEFVGGDPLEELPIGIFDTHKHCLRRLRLGRAVRHSPARR
jgi:hypothetical protein